MGELGSGRSETFTERSAVHTLDAALRFERSIDARSARIAWGFCGRCEYADSTDCNVKRNLTMMYDTRNFKKDGSERDDTKSVLSDKLTRARNAS